jgi:transposase InsO family protein/transposase-like protein
MEGFLMNEKYSDEFKLKVVQDYYNSPLGVRLVALKYNLPSKNYINDWEKYLIKKGLLPPGSTKPNKTTHRAPEHIVRHDDRSEREKQYEDEIRELKARVKYLESLESLKPFLKKKLKIREIRYEAIMELESQFSITLLTKIAGVSRTAYYKYKNREIKSSVIEDLVLDIYRKSGKRMGYRQIKDVLTIKYNLVVNHKKVLGIMQKLGIQSIVRKKRNYKHKDKGIKKNILNRDFRADKPYKKFVTDITYVPTRREMVYICTVIDLYNNEPVVWNISTKQDKSLSIETIQALSRKCDLKGSLIHSDQGVHYTNNDYIALLESLSVTQSMSRKGNCWDNACAESFFGHFKCESLYLRKKNSIRNLRDVVEMTEEYMDYYVDERPQKKLDGLPPSLYKQRYFSA